MKAVQWEYEPPPLTEELMAAIYDRNKTLLIAQIPLGKKSTFEMCSIDWPWHQKVDPQLGSRCKQERLSRDGYDLHCQATKSIPGHENKTELKLPRLRKLMNIILEHERSEYEGLDGP